MRERLQLSPVYLVIFGISELLTASAGLAAKDQWVPGIQELYRLDRLPVLRESIRVASVSSYDRTGGNNDGFGGQYSFVRKEKDGLVLADLEGPGVIYRIWTPTPTDDVMEFYFDGQEVSFLSLQSRDGDTFGHHFVSFTCELPAAGVYRVSLDAIKGPAQGQVQLFRDEAPIGPLVDLYAEQRTRAPGQDMGTLGLAEGPNNLLFKVVGRNEKSQGQSLDVTNIICEKGD